MYAGLLLLGNIIHFFSHSLIMLWTFPLECGPNLGQLGEGKPVHKTQVLLVAKLRKEHEVAADAAEMEVEVEVALTSSAASTSDTE